MPLPTAADLTNSLNTNTQMKQHLGNLAEYIRNEGATKDKLITFKVLGPNILDTSNIEYGKYYNYQDGTIGVADSTHCIAQLCEIEPNTEYQVPDFYGSQFAFYDANKVYISGLPTVVPNFKFISPSNAKYIGLTLRTEWLDQMMLCKSSEYPSTYSKYEVAIDSLHVDFKQVEGIEENISEVVQPLDINYVNIVHGAELKSSSYVSYINGNIESVQGNSSTDFCQIMPNTEYKTSANFAQQFAFYDSNKLFISGLSRPSDTTKTFVTPVNAAFARFTIPDALVGRLVITEVDLFDREVTSEGNKLRSKTLLIESDQITDLDNALAQKFGLSSLNIFDKAKVEVGSYVDFSNGTLVPNASFSASAFCEVKAESEYKTSQFYGQQFAFYDANKAYISGRNRPDDTTKVFTTPANAKYARFTVPNDQVQTLVISEREMFPNEYISHSVKLAENIIIKKTGGNSGGQEIGKPIEIWVSPDSLDSTAFKGKNAVQLAINSVTDATSSKPYVVKAKQGVYKVTKGSDFIGYLGYPSMIDMKDYVSLEGQGEHNTIIWAELPYDDAAIGVSADGATYPRNSYQTIYNKAKEVTIKNLTFVAKNLRYTLHQDDPLGSNTKRYYENVSFIYKGDKGSLNSMGIGTFDGEETYVSGGSSITDSGYPIACHSNTAFKNPSLWSFKGHHFASYGKNEAILLQNSGSLLQDKFELVGCSFGGSSYKILYWDAWLTSKVTDNFDSFNHAGWNVYGYGNDPFLFANEVNGFSLRVKTTSTGVNSSVRFGVNSSAYPILIKNNHGNTDANIFINSREYVDGYIAQDGSVGLSAQAWGCRDLAEYAAPYDDDVNYTSIGKRLGDCSSTIKTLEIIIDGTVNTVTFNKNYTSMTNAQILSEMNSQISGAVIDVYPYGRDYFPAITDVCEAVYNIGTTPILKGSLVAKTAGSIKLAGENDNVFGVALDDIPVVQITSEGVKKGQGRVMKKGYMYTHPEKAHFVLADNYNPPLGTRFKVQSGRLITDANGKISVDIDTGIVSINC